MKVVHEGFGWSSDGHTLFVNASSCTLSYCPANPAVVIDLPHDPAAEPIVVTPESKLDEHEVIEWLRSGGGIQEQEDEADDGGLPSLVVFFEDAIAAGRPVDGQQLISRPFSDLKDDLQIPLDARRNLLMLAVSQLRAQSYGARRRGGGAEG